MKKVKKGCECNDKKKESKIDTSMDDIEARRTRVEQIQSIFSDIHYKTDEDRDAAIMAFTKANLTIPEIEELVKPLRPDYLSNSKREVGVY